MKEMQFEAVESEIRQEKAQALGRAGERLERAIRELEMLRQEILPCVERTAGAVLDGLERFSADFDEKLREYARLQHEAGRLRHALVIQREAVGLRRHEDVDRQYPLPDPLRLPGQARIRDA